MISSKQRCPCCNGKGYQYSVKEGLRVLCPTCGGRGELGIRYIDNDWKVQQPKFIFS